MGCHNLLIIAIFFVAISNVKLSRHSRRNGPPHRDRTTVSGPWRPTRQDGPRNPKQWFSAITVPATVAPNSVILKSSNQEAMHPINLPKNARNSPPNKRLKRQGAASATTKRNEYKNPFLDNKMGYAKPDIANKTLFIEKVPTEKNDTTFVLIRSFRLVLKFVVLFGEINDQKTFPHMNPMSAAYYNKIYRVFLRHISTFPAWMDGSGGKYIDSHKLWTKKLQYVHEFVPSWLQRLIPWVSKTDWQTEEETFRRFQDEIDMKHIFAQQPYI